MPNAVGLLSGHGVRRMLVPGVHDGVMSFTVTGFVLGQLASVRLQTRSTAWARVIPLTVVRGTMGEI